MVLGSGIRDPEKTYSGSRSQKAPNPGSRIRVRNTGKFLTFFLFRGLILVFLDPDHDYQSGSGFANPTESGYNPDPLVPFDGSDGEKHLAFELAFLVIMHIF